MGEIMISKLLKRKRRSKKTRAKIRELQAYRLSVHRTPKHMYAQIISPENDTVVSASTLQAEVKQSLKNGKTGNIEAAEIVGKVIAQKAKKAKIEVVAFDRSGFMFHGRVKALAQAARDNGLKF
jgi:large subunit ribosomal protein L18|tara:strand:+ start:448 stop:819 length:372 start_codon:yes stop_codon:yes gene_type:complete